MTQRENLLNAMKRLPRDYVPFHLTLCESQIETLFKKTGTYDYETYFDLSARFIYLPESKNKNDYSKYHPNIPEKAVIDEWGVCQEPGSIAHFTKMHHPMEKFETVEEVYEYPYPDQLADYRWENVQHLVDKAHEQGKAAVYFAVQVFEPAWYLRGMEALMMDMISDEDMAEACISRMTEFQKQVTIRAAKTGVDIIVFGDDVGSQKSMIMSADLWRRWLKPTMKSLIDAAKQINPEVLAYYHSDGVIDEIIEDLIEIGVDILNPVQPECMDPVKIKELYHDRLSFWGTVGTQTTMPFGTTGDVRKTVKNMIETVGNGGGLCIAPTHIIEPEVPWENVMTFIESAKEFGGYNKVKM